MIGQIGEGGPVQFAEGITGAAVSTVMRDAATHGGFYKHFEGKNDMLIESLGDAFQEMTDRTLGSRRKRGLGWKAIVKAYLSPEHCDHAECGCPVTALTPELASRLHWGRLSFAAQRITLPV